MNQGREQQKVLRHKSPVERRKESKKAEKERSAGTIVNRFKAKRMFVCEQMTESGKKALFKENGSLISSDKISCESANLSPLTQSF